MQKKLNVQASEMDQHMEKLIKYYLPLSEEDETYKRPAHVDLCLTAEMTSEQFLAAIEKALHISNKQYKFGIIGQKYNSIETAQKKNSPSIKS